MSILVASLLAMFVLSRSWILISGLIGILLCSHLSYDVELTKSLIPLDFGLFSINLDLDDFGMWFLLLLAMCLSWLTLSTINKHSITPQVVVLLAYIFICSTIFFLASDLFVMYTMFELITIPILIYVGLLGVSSRRVYALSVMVIYMLMSSGLMALVLFAYLDEFMDSQYLGLSYSRTGLSSSSYSIVLLLFIFFGVKIPVFPFYIWLPEAHVESNTEMSILLASIILKFGVFGLLRVGYWIDLPLTHSYSYILLSIGLVGLLHSSISAFTNLDLKKLIAYSSIVHMHFGLLSVLSNDYMGLYVTVVSLLIHGIVSIGLFYTIGASSESIGTRHIAFIHSGLSLTPMLSLFGFVTVLLNISVPLSLAAIIEFLVLLVYSSFGSVVLFLGAMCSIWFCVLFSLTLLYRVFMSDTSWWNNDTVDISVLECLCILLMYCLLVGAIFVV